MSTVDLLTVEGLHAWYGSSQALSDVSFSVRKGGFTTLLGANGAGKTTALRAISGLVRKTGTLLFEGVPLRGVTPDMIARRGIAHVPDGRGTFKNQTVWENLQLGAYSRRDRDAVTSDIEQMLTHFPPLRERLRQPAGTLSGGEQQMLAIARALLLRPNLLLLDEPSFGVAPKVAAAIFAILRQLNSESGLSVLLVEQNATLALSISDQAYVLESGKVVLSGSCEDLRQDAAVRKTYLGY